MIQCDRTFQGGEEVPEGEKGDYYSEPESWKGHFKASSISPFAKAPKHLYNSGKAICGAAGCTRACMISLERRGVLKNKFANPFRTEKPWRVDWSAEPFPVDYKSPYEGTGSPNEHYKTFKSTTD